jgi:hypothetical protein
MPKVLIREYDKSTTGIPTSDNFAVVVPGYFGAHPGNEKDVLIDYDVYELKSQKDFEAYVGKQSNSIRNAVGPVLQVVNESSSATNYTKYLKTLTLTDFDGYFEPDNTEHIYKVTEITDSNDVRYGKQGYLYTTIKYYNKKQQQVTDADGNPQFEVDEEGNPTEIPLMEYVDDIAGGEKTVTISLTKITSLNDVTWITIEEEAASGTFYTTTTSSTSDYCIIVDGGEGSDSIQDPQMGNQIAYELLGLGYTVLYKKLDENVPAQKVQMLNDASF